MKIIDRLSGMAEAREYTASRCITVGFLGSSCQDFRGYSVIDFHVGTQSSLGTAIFDLRIMVPANRCHSARARGGRGIGTIESFTLVALRFPEAA